MGLLYTKNAFIPINERWEETVSKGPLKKEDK